MAAKDKWARRGTRPVALIAFGGNALIPEDSEGTQANQLEEAGRLAVVVGDLLEDHRLLLVHGNGPQVGHLLIQVDAARGQVPPWSLDASVGATQGIIGYLLEIAIRERLERLECPDQVSTLMTLVEVDAGDPAFERPTKPIGPFYPTFRAEELQQQRGWEMVRQDVRGWRQVVPSPRPQHIHGSEAIRSLLDQGHVVIAGGGGGIPVVRDATGSLCGVDAVIDKDHTAAMLGDVVGADLLVILTGVDQVQRDFGTDRAVGIDRLTPAEARKLLDEGHFPPGSMGPKIESAMAVVERSGRPVVITSVKCLPEALRGRGGTWIVAAPRDEERGRGKRQEEKSR